MSINKKNFLATKPTELGLKDAIHVAIVSVRARRTMSPGQNFTMKDGEAIPATSKDSVGVVSPFLRKNVARGESFWALLKMDEIESVKHVWDHPKFTFEAPKTPPSVNEALKSMADDLKVTYEQLMDACNSYMEDGKSVKYPGTLTEDEFENVSGDLIYELWSEWSDETNREFENSGSSCCPEYDYPETIPFYWANNE